MTKTDQATIEKKQAQQVEEAPYSDKEKDYFGFLKKRLFDAKNQRELPWTELDGMSYAQYYDSNAKAGNSYNPPKENVDDTRIVTGTTLEKENALLNSLLNLNLEPDIEAFDNEDLPFQSLADTMEVMVKKSRQIERYEKNRRLIYKEALDQGTWYVEEIARSNTEIVKELKQKDYAGLPVKSIDWTHVVKTGKYECQAGLIDGLKVFMGNMREFFVEKQPYLYTIEYIPYTLCERMFGDMERWKYVPKKTIQSAEAEKDTDTSSYRTYRLYNIHQELVEVIRYQDKPANEYMLQLNGAMMLPIGFPLSALTGDAEYSIVKGDIEPISRFFAISKAFPAKTKVHQAVLDEFLRLIILKSQAHYKPPLSNRTGRVLSSRIFKAGTITPNINPDDLKEIGKNEGVTQSDIAAYQMVKGVVDELTVSSQFQGLEQKTKTATQTLEDKKQNLMKIGMAVIGIVEFEKDLCYRRIQNILSTWTQPVDMKIDSIRGEIQNVYRTISITDEIGGVPGIKQVMMTNENYKSPEEVLGEEKALTEHYGMPVQRTYLNPELLKGIKYRWYIEITPTEKQTSELKMEMFKNKIVNAGMIFGVESLNLEALKKRYSQMAGEDYDTFFTAAQSQSMMGGMGGAPAARAPTPAGQPRPTVNALAGQAG